MHLLYMQSAQESNSQNCEKKGVAFLICVERDKMLILLRSLREG